MTCYNLRMTTNRGDTPIVLDTDQPQQVEHNLQTLMHRGFSLFKHPSGEPIEVADQTVDSDVLAVAPMAGG